MKLMCRSVYADIEGLVFHDLASLNEAIRKSLDEFNDRKMSGRKESRRERAAFPTRNVRYIPHIPPSSGSCRGIRKPAERGSCHFTANRPLSFAATVMSGTSPLTSRYPPDAGGSGSKVDVGQMNRI